MADAEVIWESQGRLHRYTVKPGQTLFIGRPDKNLLQTHPNLNPLETHIIPVDPPGNPVPTGIQLLTISRLHTKIKTSNTGDTVEITNHGLSGRGAKNPTLVNGQPIPPGQTVKLPLDTTITIDLTSIGPTFTITPRRTLTIPRGQPVRLPASIARELIARGLVEESAQVDQDTTTIIASGALGRVLAKLEDLNIVIREIHEDLHGKQKEKMQLHLIKEKLLTIYMEIDTQPRKALSAISELKLTPYKNRITSLDTRAKTLYNEIIILAQQPPTPTTIKQIKQKIQELTQQIKAHEETQQ